MSKQKRKFTNEKADCLGNSKADRDAIYEIYRSCRLCGAGAGYKMPIVQNIVNIDDSEVELKTKIRECIQIQVHQNDKMPPLICELCVDKVNDFYEFLEMCRQTNKQTRIRLGLPSQVLTRGDDDNNCILGVTGPVFVKTEDSSSKENDKGKSTKSKDNGKGRLKTREIKKEVTVKTEKISRLNRELRELMGSNQRTKISKLPPRRLNSRSRDDGEKIQKEATASPANSRLKRIREKEPQIKQEVHSKKVKIVETPPSRSTRMSKLESTVVYDSAGGEMKTCEQCGASFPKGRSFGNHLRKHTASKNDSVEIECSKCSRKFILGMLVNHKCRTVEKSKPVGKCKKCGKPFEVYRSLMRHQSACRRGKVEISAVVHKSLRPLHVRTMRCDSLLQNERGGHYDVSNVRCPFGLDKSCVYIYNPEQPHTILHYDRMVHITDDLKTNDDFVNWDSDTTSDDDISSSVIRKVESLSTLALKTIFSDKLLGKVPKKRKRIKTFDNDFRFNIDNIISNLDDDDKKSSKSILDNIKDNWSDNASDSILKNGYDSDRTNFNEEFNDDDVLVDKNSSNDKSVDKLTTSNDISKSNFVIEENTNSLDDSEATLKTKEANEVSGNQKENSELSDSYISCIDKNGDNLQRKGSHSCSKSKKCKKSTNNENILELTKEITEMRINDRNGETATCEEQDINDQGNSDTNTENSNHFNLVNQTDNDDTTHTNENYNANADLSENMIISLGNTISNIENNETINKNDEAINNKDNGRENLNTMNSEIEVLDIQIISDNHEISTVNCVYKDESAVKTDDEENNRVKSKNVHLEKSEFDTILNNKSNDGSLNIGINKSSNIISDITMEIEVISELETAHKDKDTLEGTKDDIEANKDINIDNQNAIGADEQTANKKMHDTCIEKNADTPFTESNLNNVESDVNKTEKCTINDEKTTELNNENNIDTNSDHDIDLNDLEDISDDDKLMNEINAQIGDNECNKILADLLPNKSTDLDNISDGEFTMED